MKAFHRSLEGCFVSLSLSEGGDSATRGFPSWQVDRVTVQVVAALVGQGAGVIFGHDWRPDGVMEAVYNFARQTQSPMASRRDGTDIEGQPLLRNLLPWPDASQLTEPEQDRLSSTLVVESAGLPSELRAAGAEALHSDPHSSLHRYVRARGLTHLRHRLNERSNARLCLGGRRSGFAGRYPGVIEEAFLALESNKPLFLAGALGGATQQLVDAIDGNEISDDFCRNASVTELYAQPPAPEFELRTSADRVIDRQAVWERFREGGLRQIADTNGLTVGENEELLHTPVLDRVVELVLISLSRLG